MKRIKSFLFTVIFFTGAFLYASVSKEKIKSGTILHCWCWSFKTIEENIPSIAEAGFSSVQTSPANTCVVGDYGGLDILGADVTGKWYYHYQPTDWKIGNYQLGTRDDFISMCKKADEYGIAVIVDVLPNHTTPRKNQLSEDFVKAVGGIDKMYHAKGERDIINYNSRFEITNQKMGGLPDVNTENPLFQSYFMKYINDLIDCGASGLRYDTARHIALPDDPKDSASAENDFWPIFTGKKAVNGVWLKNKENIFIYGEVLQGGAARESDYAEYIDITASNYGSILRRSIPRGIMSAQGLKDWKNPAGGNKLVTWVESHDTYANYGESVSMTNFQLRAGYALITARKEGTPLFFNRPQGPEGVQFPGVSKIGDMGNDEFKHPEVTAVNKFRTAMINEEEEILNGNTNSVIMVKRGSKGIVIINISQSGAQSISVPINLPNGKYTDKANAINFTVKNGILSGKIKNKKIAVIY